MKTPDRLEIHCDSSPRFTKEFGRKVRAEGGDYTTCRGHSSKRFVTLPILARGTITDVVNAYGLSGRVTIVGRYDCTVSLPSWVVVQYVGRKTDDAVSDYLGKYMTRYAEAEDRCLVRWR